VPSLVDPGGKLVNYLVTTNRGTLRVNAATLTLTARDAVRAYGSTNPAFSASISGLVSGDIASMVSGAPEFSTLATTNSPVGAYAIVPAVGTLSADNYQFGNFVNGP